MIEDEDATFFLHTRSRVSLKHSSSSFFFFFLLQKSCKNVPREKLVTGPQIPG